jgi:hypothetical protein
MAPQSAPRLCDPLPRSGCNRKKSVHFRGSLPCSYMNSDSPPRLRSPEPQVKKGGPLSRLAPLLCVGADFSQPHFLRLSQPHGCGRGGPLSEFVTPLGSASRNLIDAWASPPPSGAAAPVASPVASRPGRGQRPAIAHSSAVCGPFALPTFLRLSQFKTRPRRSHSCSLSTLDLRPLHSTPSLTPPRWFGSASPPARRLLRSASPSIER